MIYRCLQMKTRRMRNCSDMNLEYSHQTHFVIRKICFHSDNYFTDIHDSVLDYTVRVPSHPPES